MIHLLISTCVMGGGIDRRYVYLQRISHAFNQFRKVVPDIKVVVLNNCGQQNADYLLLLEDDDLKIFHTTNQFTATNNKGWKELKDVKDYIDYYNVADDDFIIKLTGRYLIEENSMFLTALKDEWTSDTECIIRLGGFNDHNIKYIRVGDDIDCLSGLIGFKCKYFKDMPLPCEEYQAVEWIMAEASINIDESKKIILSDLGINIF